VSGGNLPNQPAAHFMIEWSKNLSLFDENTQSDWRMIVESDKILSFTTFLIASLTVREIPPQHPKQAARTRGSRLI
jgi:hypothetical protein